MPLAKFSQYSTIEPLLSQDMLPSWIPNGDDKIRCAAYDLYEQIYRNIPHAFEILQRGTEVDPIYLPSARKCIEATNRYLGVGFDYALVGGNDADRKVVGDALNILFRREKFRAKFSSIKRFSLIKGDALWHVVANPDAPQGRRISLHELDPGSYFPIYDIDDTEKLLGVHIVAPYVDPNDKQKSLVKRQTYRKIDNGPGNSNTITSELAIFESDGWDDRQLLVDDNYQLKPYKSLVKQFNLPAQITSIPVYHISNQYQGGLQFGLSDLSGFERVIAALHQAITDEELSLALDGLGVYWSTAAAPSTGWALGPGSVVEGADGEAFERISGVTNVTPFQDHLSFLNGEIKQAMGTPDIAIGNVDVQVAQSGIALALQMGPIIARNSEKEDELLATQDHLLFDLINGWLPAYESLPEFNISAEPKFADPMPVDRDAVIKEITTLLGTTPPVISAEYARKVLTDKLGYEFPDTMGDDIIAEIQANSKAKNYDPFAERIREELAGDFGEAGIATNLGTG